MPDNNGHDYEQAPDEEKKVCQEIGTFHWLCKAVVRLPIKELLIVMAGVVVLLVGIITIFTPGPAIILIPTGLVLIGFDLTFIFRVGEKYVPYYTPRTTRKIKENKWIKKILKWQVRRREKKKARRKSRE